MLCDIVVLYCMKKRYYYREKKYKYVEDYELVSTSKGRMEAGLFPPLILKQDVQSPYHTQTLYRSCEEGLSSLELLIFSSKLLGEALETILCFLGNHSWKGKSVFENLCSHCISLWVAVLGSCLLQGTVSSASIKSLHSLQKFLLLQPNPVR